MSLQVTPPQGTKKPCVTTAGGGASALPPLGRVRSGSCPLTPSHCTPGVPVGTWTPPSACTATRVPHHGRGFSLTPGCVQLRPSWPLSGASPPQRPVLHDGSRAGDRLSALGAALCGRLRGEHRDALSMAAWAPHQALHQAPHQALRSALPRRAFSVRSLPVPGQKGGEETWGPPGPPCSELSLVPPTRALVRGASPGSPRRPQAPQRANPLSPGGADACSSKFSTTST